MVYNFTTWAPPIIGFVLLPLYTSYLTPSDYGVRAMVLLAMVIFDVISNLGLNWVIRSKYSRLGEERGRYMFTVLLYSLSFKLIIITVLFPFFDTYLHMLMSQWNSFYTDLFYMQLVVFFLNGFSVVFTELFVMERNAKQYSYTFIASYLCNIIVALFCLVYLKKGILSIFWGEIVQGAVFASVSLLTIHNDLKIGFVKDVFSDILHIGLPALPKSSFAQIQQRIDQYFMQIFFPIGVLGIYSKSQFIKSGMDGMNKSFSRAYSPSYIKDVHRQADTSYTRDLTTKWMLTLGVIYLFFLLFLLDIFKVMKVNPEFYMMATIAPMLAMRSVIMGFGTMFSNNILIAEKAYAFTLRSVVAGLVSIALNFWLIPVLETLGAIVASVVSAMIITGFGYFYSEKKLKYETSLHYAAYFSIVSYLVAVTAVSYVGLLQGMIMKVSVFGFTLAVWFLFIKRGQGRVTDVKAERPI